MDGWTDGGVDGRTGWMAGGAGCVGVWVGGWGWMSMKTLPQSLSLHPQLPEPSIPWTLDFSTPTTATLLNQCKRESTISEKKRNAPVLRRVQLQWNFNSPDIPSETHLVRTQVDHTEKSQDSLFYFSLDAQDHDDKVYNSHPAVTEAFTLSGIEQRGQR